MWCWKIRLVGVHFFNADRWKDGKIKKANSRSSLYKGAQKLMISSSYRDRRHEAENKNTNLKLKLRIYFRGEVCQFE